MTAEEFRKVWIPLADGFYRVAYYMLESAGDAEDAVQDLYVRLWKSRGSLDSVLKPNAYGLAMIRNICIDRIRQAASARTASLDDDDASPIMAGNPPPDEVVIGKEELKILETLIAGLPEKQAMILRMRFFDDLSYEEMSQKTGLTGQNLRVVVSNARKLLKKQMEERI